MGVYCVTLYSMSNNVDLYLAEILDVEELAEHGFPELRRLPESLEAALHLPHTLVLNQTYIPFIDRTQDTDNRANMAVGFDRVVKWSNV